MNHFSNGANRESVSSLIQHTENLGNVEFIIYEERPNSGVSLHHSRSGTMIYWY